MRRSFSVTVLAHERWGWVVCLCPSPMMPQQHTGIPQGSPKSKNMPFQQCILSPLVLMEDGSSPKDWVQYNFVNYVQQIENIGTIGISWIRLGVDDIPLTTFVDKMATGF